MARIPPPIDVTFEGAQWKLRVPQDDHIGRTITDSGAPYEPRLLRTACQLLNAGDFVVDVGANIGNHTICFAKVAGARVLAFEPNPAARYYLDSNIVLNDLNAQVSVSRYAVGDRAGNAQLGVLTPGNLGATALAYGSGPIGVVRLDDFNLTDVRMLKIDTEGNEAAVVAGARQLISEQKPYVFAEAETVSEIAALDALLVPLGYVRQPENLGWTPTFLWSPKATGLVSAQ